jgi:glycosyltransferase involved in cell wall biosynthesis
MKRLVVIPHLFATTVFQEVHWLLGLYVYLSEKPLVPIYAGHKFNVISASTADDIAVRGIPRDDISIIHCGIDRETYSPDDSVSKYDCPTILYLGRIKKYKSIQHAILALKRIRSKLPDARLMVVGNGDYLPKLKDLAASLELTDAVEFTGYVPLEDKLERLRRAHVAILPSLKEGWGLTNIEANAVGTTVVAANSPGLRDSVDNGSSGFLYEYGNIDELTDKLTLILSDAETRRRLEQGALRWAEKFNWDSAARSFERLLLDITEPAK